ncbi:trehalase-like domain-containing protein [Paraburkholderia heleia]|uniref:trehalase-like domain-containing protein n=1 Tax=Paraburkholderia heleia TaxID=634127 RepID=UPI0006945368|nr:trehalase-like domain-containing protein [Paraburkholderia heleia]
MTRTRLIEDYALLADGRSAALLAREGSIDWLCWPRFDSEPCFAALLGGDEEGHWRLAPADPACRASRGYQRDTLVIETAWESERGSARVIDFMAADSTEACIVRMVEGTRGSVDMHMIMQPRRADGPAVRAAAIDTNGAATLHAAGGPLTLRADVPLRVHAQALEAAFTVREGERFALTLCHGESAGGAGESCSFRALPVHFSACLYSHAFRSRPCGLRSRLSIARTPRNRRRR